MKVAICVISTDDWKADFGMSLAGLISYASTVPTPGGEIAEIRVFNTRMAYLPFSRNLLFREALAWHADWILHVETDMYFPRDTLHRLIAWGKDCVVANFNQRRMLDGDVARANAALRSGNGRFGGTAVNGGCAVTRSPVDLHEVELAAFGLVLIRAQMLRKVPPPWADYDGPLDINAESCETTHAMCPNHAFVSDDYYFCMRMREHGYKIYVDGRLSDEVRHVGMARFSYSGPEFVGNIFYA